ncbi:MAG: AAA family ATPase [Desulfatitalea sp.]|nr:helix-turn-helix domain-containing protein [Desulfatitalea sp.]NNK00351.1 AAA family ATPase [Desulfatitalea sp.]
MDTTNTELRLSEAYVQHTDCHIFLTGKAGTGKTTFLKEIQKKCLKRMVVAAPTGVAAINAGGVTLHSLFQIPFGPFIPGGKINNHEHRLGREKQNIIRSLDLLIIDEISMVRADLLDAVDRILRHYRRSDAPFGGVQLLMIGDLHQLSPVAKKDEWQLLEKYYDTPYFFSSTALARTEWITIELKHIYRQSDQHFIELLNRVRDNQLDTATLQQLNVRCIPDFSPQDGEGYITLSTHNRSADAINESKFRRLSGRSHNFEAELQGDFPEQAFPTAASLELKPGAQVMFIRNDMSAEKSYYNGKIGRITSIDDKTIEVRCQGESYPVYVGKTTWENIEYTVDPKTAEISQKVIGLFSQYPLRLAWAITIHKSQGLTFDKAIIDAQAAFAHGQVYVALSRCRSLEGIVLSAPLTPIAVKSDPAVHHFLAEVEKNTSPREKLASAKSRYQQHLLLECFDFENLDWLLGRLTELLHGNAKTIQVLGGVDIAEIQQRTDAEIVTVGKKFRRQLQGMFGDTVQPANDPAVQDRLTKAAVYFQEKFATILNPYLDSIAVETDNKEIRKRINDTIKVLREIVAVKQAGVLSCREEFSSGKYLRALSTSAMEASQPKKKKPSIVYTAADVGHPELFETLRQWRKEKAAEEGIALFQVLHQKTLVQIAVHLPQTIKALKKIKGIGPRLAEKYGEELTTLVVDYRQRSGIVEVVLPEPAAPQPSQDKKAEPAHKEDTKKVSLELFQKGLTIPQVALQRGLKTTTIKGHIAFFISKGEVEITEVLKEDKRRTIERTIGEIPNSSLKEIKTALGDHFSYGDIKLVQAYLEYMGQRTLTHGQ